MRHDSQESYDPEVGVGVEVGVDTEDVFQICTVLRHVHAEWQGVKKAFTCLPSGCITFCRTGTIFEVFDELNVPNLRDQPWMLRK